MVKQNSYKTLFFIGTLLIVPLHAAHYLDQEEGKSDVQEQTYIEQLPVGYYNYTLQHSKRKIDNTAYPEELEDEKKDFKRNNIVEELKNKKGAVFFMVITSNKKTEELSKLFFINRNPNTEKDAVRRVQKSYGCHVISNSNVKLSSHVAFQLLGWLEQEARRCTPVHIHVSSPLCVTCHAIVLHLFHLDMPKSSKGCSDASAIDFEKVCPLAKKHINSGLTLALAKKILLPSVSSVHDKLRVLEDLENKRKQLKENYIKEKNQLEERYSRDKNRLEEKYNKDKKKLEEEINKIKIEREKEQKELTEHANKLRKETKRLSEEATKLSEAGNKLIIGKQKLYEESTKLYKEQEKLAKCANQIVQEEKQLKERTKQVIRETNKLTNELKKLDEAYAAEKNKLANKYEKDNINRNIAYIEAINNLDNYQSHSDDNEIFDID